MQEKVNEKEANNFQLINEWNDEILLHMLDMIDAKNRIIPIGNYREYKLCSIFGGSSKEAMNREIFMEQCYLFKLLKVNSKTTP